MGHVRPRAGGIVRYSGRVIQAGVSTLVHWLGLTLGRIHPADDGQRRYVALARGASSALAARGLSVLTGLLIVPISLRYLGAERYGAWVTIGSSLSWLYLADLGLGNGLTNLLSEARAHHHSEVAQTHVATAFWMLAGIASFCGVALALLWPRIDWAELLNVHSDLARSEVSDAVALAAAIFLATIPLGIVDRIYAACQEGAVANFWAGTASVATLLALAWAVRGAGGMIALVLAISGGRLAVHLVSAAWLFTTSHPELKPLPSALRRASLQRLSRSGGLFFAIQVAGLILFNTDNVIIAHVLGADRVTPYSIAWSLFTLPSMAFALAMPYLWPAYAEAFARRDGGWIRQAFRTSVLVSLAIAVAVAVPMIAFGRPLIALWAGKVAVPPFSLLLWMGAWSLVFAGMNPVACLLNAAGRLKGQAIYASLSTAVNIALSVAWARRYGITGVIAATVASYMVFAALPICLEVARLLSQVDRLADAEGEG